jgi:hypothetical protein
MRPLDTKESDKGGIFRASGEAPELDAAVA